MLRFWTFITQRDLQLGLVTLIKDEPISHTTIGLIFSSTLKTRLQFKVCPNVILFHIITTGATKLPNQSQKQRAFREPCSSFHHEPVRIIYSHKCYKTNFQTYNHYLFFHYVHVTVKPHLTLKTMKGQQFRLYSFDAVKFIFDNCCSPGLQLRKVVCFVFF